MTDSNGNRMQILLDNLGIVTKKTRDIDHHAVLDQGKRAQKQKLIY